MSDQELVGRMRRGNAAALSRWVELHADALHGFVFYRVGRDPELAAEVVQETFTRALEQLDKFDADRGPMIAWLCTLSRNCIRDSLRQRGNAPLAALWDSLDHSLQRVVDDLDRAPLASDALEARETQDLVGMTLANMPETYRSVLEAKYVEGRSLKDIAEERRSTPDAVKGLLRRARELFRRTFNTLAGAAPYLEESGGAR